MVTLAGDLGFVPIDEVLRLLTRSKQQGAVDVTGIGFRGRVFVGNRGVDLATTWDDGDLHQHLLNSGYADAKSLDRINTGESTLAVIAENNNEMIDLLREMTIESLYQVGTQGDEFRVVEGRTTPYASPKAFDLETLLDDVQSRQKDWEKVSDVVSDLTGSIAFRRDLGDREEVTIKTDDWKVLSEIGAGASVAEIAEKLGTTQFWAAKIAARLIGNDLIVVPVDTFEEDDSAEYVEADQPEDSPAWGSQDDEVETEPADEYEVSYDDVDEPSDEPEVEVAELADSDDEMDSADSEDADEASHADSWWQEPEDETEESVDDGSATPEVVAEGLSEIPAIEDSEDDEEVAEDTEAFLEKVFSELESEEPKADEGHGLLRRRRMGTLRDFSSDS